jgi:hypothetical protein
MAKRKLSQSQRASIRKELAALLRTAKTKADALRAVAKKYGITTITARWYAKSLKGAASPTAKPAKAVAPKSQARVARKAPSARNGTSNGVAVAASRLVASLASAAELAVARVKQAKKLVPKWQAYVRKELTLKKAERRVRAGLRAASRMARVLERKIKDLSVR